jgi:hypothetical protein
MEKIKRENDFPFTSLVKLDMHDWSHGYLKNGIAKKKKVQSVHINPKQKVSQTVFEL